MSKNKLNDLAYDASGLVLIGGIFSIIFGVVALVWPGITLVSLAVLTAVWLIVGGLVNGMTSIFMRDKYEHWVINLALAALKFGVGAYLVQRPDITVATFVLLIAISFIAEGIADVVFGIVDKDGAGIKILSILVGLFTVGAGVMIWRYPVEGTLAFVWVLGLIALVRGTVALWLAIDARHELKK